jgi:hypothetical protein
MKMAETIRRNDPQVDTIILTSEDRRFVDARLNYSTTNGKQNPWWFIVNPFDVMQASGDSSVTRNHTMDEIFLSFFSSFTCR